MRIFAGGREIEVPTDTQGNVNVVDVRRAANIPNDRMLVQQRPEGENIILPRQGQIAINPSDRFMDAPRAVRGIDEHTKIKK
jgi:hypothetical protein